MKSQPISSHPRNKGSLKRSGRRDGSMATRAISRHGDAVFIGLHLCSSSAMGKVAEGAGCTQKDADTCPRHTDCVTLGLPQLSVQAESKKHAAVRFLCDSSRKMKLNTWGRTAEKLQTRSWSTKCAGASMRCGNLIRTSAKTIGNRTRTMEFRPLLLVYVLLNRRDIRPFFRHSWQVLGLVR